MHRKLHVGAAGRPPVDENPTAGTGERPLAPTTRFFIECEYNLDQPMNHLPSSGGLPEVTRSAGGVLTAAV